MPSSDELTKKSGTNIFLLANAIATRAKEISEGSIPFVEDYNPVNPIETSMKEFSRGKFDIKILKGPAPKPMKVIEAKAKDFWTLDNLQKETRKKSSAPAKKATKSKK